LSLDDFSAVSVTPIKAPEDVAPCMIGAIGSGANRDSA